MAEHYTLPRLEFIEKGNPKVLEGEDVIDSVILTTYIVRYDLATDFSEPRKARIYNSALSQSAMPFVSVEKTTPTPVIGLFKCRKLSAYSLSFIH